MVGLHDIMNENQIVDFRNKDGLNFPIRWDKSGRDLEILIP